MEELSCFELAGYTKEESKKLMEVCYQHSMSYDKMLKFLRTFDNSTEVLEELFKCDKSPLEIAWGGLIESMANALGLYKILDWLNSKLSKFKEW